MGASMMAPDYTQWHGFFEVAERFYTELLPEAKELGHGKPEVEQTIAKILAMPQHAWKKGLNKEQAEKIRSFYKQRYGQGGVHKAPTAPAAAPIEATAPKAAPPAPSAPSAPRAAPAPAKVPTPAKVPAPAKAPIPKGGTH